MSIFSDTINNTRGYSAAMYSTWLYHQSTRTLFDCGEGVSTSMRNHVFAVDKVFLSHGHYDHIGGLAGLIFARASARGDKEKPLSVYYHAEAHQVSALRDFIGHSSDFRDYELNWIKVQDGDEIAVAKNLKAEVFEVHHTRGSVGYRLVETRRQLKVELQGKPEKEIAAIAKEHGRAAVVQEYTKTVLAYCGDSAPVRASSVAGAEVLVHEATFLDDSERRGNNHSTVKEALEAADYAGVGGLLLIHVSGRYNQQDTVDFVRKTAREVGWTKPLAVIVGRRVIDITGHLNVVSTH